jgi:hypothetical protein
MVRLAPREKRVPLQLVVHVTGEEDGAPFTDYTTTVNISGGGVCFESARAIPLGARLELRVQVPAALQRHFGGVPVYGVRAVVCRMEKMGDGPLHRIGARFTGPLGG